MTFFCVCSLWMGNSVSVVNRGVKSERGRRLLYIMQITAWSSTVFASANMLARSPLDLRVTRCMTEEKQIMVMDNDLRRHP